MTSQPAPLDDIEPTEEGRTADPPQHPAEGHCLSRSALASHGLRLFRYCLTLLSYGAKVETEDSRENTHFRLYGIWLQGLHGAWKTSDALSQRLPGPLGV